MRILNCGFFVLNDEYIEHIRKLPCVSDESLDVKNVRRRTFLPIIDNACSPREVFSLVATAIELADPQPGDVVVVTGTPDVVFYVVSMVAAREGGEQVRVVCPLGRSTKDTGFRIQGFREIMPLGADAADALFTYTEED